MNGHMKLDAKGTLRMGVNGANEVYLSAQRFHGTETVDMDLSAEEAIRLGKYLQKLGLEAAKLKK